MKRTSSHPANDCQLQLKSALQMIAQLEQTVMSQQQANQALTEENIRKDRIIADRDQAITALQAVQKINQQTITVLEEKNRQHIVIIDKLNNVVREQLLRLQKNKSDLFDYKMLRYQWMQLKKMIYGRKSEKRYPNEMALNTEQKNIQGKLFDVPAANHEDVVPFTSVRKIKEQLVVVSKNILPLPHPGRHALPAHLMRCVVKIHQDVPAGAVKVGTERTERLAVQMMKLYVNVEERDVYIMKADDKGKHKQLIAPTGAHPIPKCKADITLLVMLLIEKFIYHMPLYRIQQRFKQYSINLKYNTISNWVNATIDVLKPLWELLWEDLVNSRYIHMDETRYRVLDNTRAKGKGSHNGYLWVGGNPVLQIVCFIYKKGRGKGEIRDILSGFRGYLHTDAYSGYEEYGKQPGVTHLHCMDHARRYFVDALNNDEQRSSYALDHFFAPLYQIERECKERGLSYDEITDMRQQRAVPVLNALREWITKEISEVIEGSPVYTAMAYTLKRMKQLMEYCNDGMLSISNMFIEVRLVCFGTVCENTGRNRATIVA
ncbi:IS66 family transposase [Chitinophaga sancti]|uniref:IS66 family transposase n=1 Tax=Chitinophaga sancti TaxID=1004 RepID=UPI002A74A383|nr:IS66 family transposase [Chitinophaga sancti]WPQ63349.1 IS66 family transposase [Chitinophaga sancti]